MIFEEKTFYKINNLVNIAIPSDFEKNQELALLNKFDCSLIKIKYKVGQKDSNNNLASSIESIHELYFDKNQEGNISLQGKFLSLNQRNPNNFFLRTLGKPVFGQINKWKLMNKPQKYIYYQQNGNINRNDIINNNRIQMNNMITNNQQIKKVNNIRNQGGLICEQCIYCQRNENYYNNDYMLQRQEINNNNYNKMNFLNIIIYIICKMRKI